MDGKNAEKFRDEVKSHYLPNAKSDQSLGENASSGGTSRLLGQAVGRTISLYGHALSKLLGATGSFPSPNLFSDKYCGKEHVAFGVSPQKLSLRNLRN